jgi:phosphoenolpyruvate---glycerone phosphotransferase subunit DhaL
MGNDVVTMAGLGAWLREFGRIVTENKEYLTQLDSAIGDADHGINLDRGMKAVIEALDAGEFAVVSELLKKVGMTLVTTVGGASGALYGTYFLRFGMASGDITELSAAGFGEGLRAGLEGVVARGKPELGDKTMFDAMAPATDAFDNALAAGMDLTTALQEASAAAEEGRDATIPLRAKKGRASYLGERSIGHQDPGATSTAMLFSAAAAALS